jgi:hypothetical protein
MSPQSRSSKNLSLFYKSKHSPKISIILSNQSITMSKSQRFAGSSHGSPVAGYLNPFASNVSDFNLKRKRRGNIGYGDKTDFTKLTRNNPGVGEYRLPSIFDRYTWCLIIVNQHCLFIFIMEAKAKCQIFLIIGYLGSGKTTFIKNLIKIDKLSSQMAIIQNEFSEGKWNDR